MTELVPEQMPQPLTHIVMDDDPEKRQELEWLLGRTGDMVQTIASPLEAARLLRTLPRQQWPDAVWLDSYFQKDGGPSTRAWIQIVQEFGGPEGGLNVAYDSEGQPAPVEPNPNLSVVVGISTDPDQARLLGSWVAGASNAEGALILDYRAGNPMLHIPTLRDVIRYARQKQ